MIVPMQKVTLLCLASDREATLDTLREWGVMHLEPVQAPEGKDLDAARARLARVNRALDALPAAASGAVASGEPVEQAVENILSALDRQRECSEELEALRQERARLLPFGNFDPQALAELAAKGVHVRLYFLGAGRKPEAPDGVAIQILSKAKAGTYFAAVSREPISLDAQELKMPELPLSEVERRIGDLEARLAETHQSVQRYSADGASIRRYADELLEAVHFLEAREGMGAESAIAYLRGFCPSDKVEWLRSAAAKNGWGLQVQEPSDEDGVPTLIRYPAWVKPIKAVFDFIGVLPGYKEIESSAVFLLFLGIFFGMIVGDAGYGLVFIALTFWARRKMPKAPAYPFQLMYVMSVCTVVWGTITGTWLGASRLPPLLDGFAITWLKDTNNVMLLCFMIGSIQLSVAHLWNAVRSLPSLGALAQLGWIGTTWTMFFMARMMVIGHAFPPFMLNVFWVSVALIVLFMMPVKQIKHEWFNFVMLPLNLVSNFVDVVSYVRLYAVGVAGFAVANAFNEMVLAGGWRGIGYSLLAALILFAGHALNILLCAMGVLVHGVRLNTLEFAAHLGTQWSGVPYRPFARLNSENVDQ